VIVTAARLRASPRATAWVAASAAVGAMSKVGQNVRISYHSGRRSQLVIFRATVEKCGPNSRPGLQ
jgi:hypothetical protein